MSPSGQYPEFELWLKEHYQGYAADSQAEGSRVSQEAKLPNVFDRQVSCLPALVCPQCLD